MALTDSRANVAAIAALKTIQHFSRLDIAALTSPRSSLTARLQSLTQLNQRCSLSDFSVIAVIAGRESAPNQMKHSNY